MITIEILETCRNCEGKGEKWTYNYNSKEFGVCSSCNGKGKVLLVKEHLVYKLESANRYINLYWNILKHKEPLTYDVMCWFESNLTKICDECYGEGGWWEQVSEIKVEQQFLTYEKRKCKKCKGYGKLEPTKKDYYNAIFEDYLKYKQIKKECKELLDNKQWEKKEYTEYKPKYSYGSSWVCVKCKYFFQQCSTGVTPYCCNESMCGDTVGFVPINEKARQWYNNGGYKKNLNYNPKKDYRV